MAAKGQRGTDVYLILLNNSTQEQTTLIRSSDERYSSDGTLYNEQGSAKDKITLNRGATTLTMTPLSLRVVTLSRATNRHSSGDNVCKAMAVLPHMGIGG